MRGKGRYLYIILLCSDQNSHLWVFTFANADTEKGCCVASDHNTSNELY